MGRATVKDVAARAGVSPKTVSNVMNGTFPVSPATRERVELAMTELDYVPNFSARGLRNGRTGMIALALPELNTAYSAELAHHFVHHARAQGWAIQIEETKGGPEPEHQLMLKARAQLVDGLILNPVSLETSALQPGVALPPVVVIGEVDQPIADHVWIDNVEASAAMVSYLADRGRHRIAAVGVMESESARLRVRGYRDGLAAAGLPYDPDLEVTTEGWGPGAAAAVIGDLLDRATRCRCAVLLHRCARDGRPARPGPRRSAGAGRHRGGGLRRHLGVGVLRSGAHHRRVRQVRAGPDCR